MLVFGKLLRESAVIFLLGPASNVQSSIDDGNSEHDRLSANEMKAKVRLCGDVLKPREHVNLFYKALHFGQWYQTLSKESEEEEIVHNGREQSFKRGRLG